MKENIYKVVLRTNKINVSYIFTSYKKACNKMKELNNKNCCLIYKGNFYY